MLLPYNREAMQLWFITIPAVQDYTTLSESRSTLALARCWLLIKIRVMQVVLIRPNPARHKAQRCPLSVLCVVHITTTDQYKDNRIEIWLIDDERPCRWNREASNVTLGPLYVFKHWLIIRNMFWPISVMQSNYWHIKTLQISRCHRVSCSFSHLSDKSHLIVPSYSCAPIDVPVINHVNNHYDDVIMTTIASQITSLTIVNSIVYSDADQRKHQSSASLAFVRGIHRGPVNSPHKWPVTRKMFPFDDVIMVYLAK